MTRCLHVLSLSILFILIQSHQVTAATIRVVAAGPGELHLEGSGFADVAAGDLTLLFDPDTFQAPQVQAGELIEGALLAANPISAGRVRLAFVHSRTIHGSGKVAVIRGTPQGQTGVRVLNLQGSLHDPNGKSLPLRIELPPGQPGLGPSGKSDRPVIIEEKQPSNSPKSSVRTQIGAPAPVTYSGGTISSLSFPAEVDPPPAMREVRDQTVDLPNQIPAQRISPREDTYTGMKGTARYKASEEVSYLSVLSRFYEYKGPRTMTHLGELFKGALSPTISQIPSIAFSDGKSPILLRIEGAEAPNLALSDGRLLQVGRGEGESWEIELIPENGSWLTTVFVLEGGRTMEIPLVVVPRLEGAVEEHCSLLWGEGQDRQPEVPKFDYNGDGKIDASDDYLVVSNCLAMRLLPEE